MVNSNTLSEVFSSRQEVQQALSQLRDAGFPMAQVSQLPKAQSSISSLAVLT